jgi:DNA-binding transcriptional LysR family regulator
MWITLDQIECLRAISEAGSITAASKKLHRAKSAVHYSLKKLEEQVGFKLVDTGEYRGSITVKGKQFLLRSIPILEEVSELQRITHRIATGVETKLSISTTTLFDLLKFNRGVKKIQSSYPDTEITIHRELLSGVKMLNLREVDLAILESPANDERIESKQIGEITMMLVIAKDHPFFKKKKSNQCKEDLFQYPQIIQRSTIPDDDQRGVYQNSRQWTVSDLTAKRQIILDGLGWGRIPKHDMEKELKSGKLIHLDYIEEPRKLPIHIARRKSEDHGDVSCALWKIFE